MASRKSNRVTLADVARQTGYSLTAVSRALRGKSDIGPETTARICQVAHEMGYVANQTAVALRSGRTMVITLIMLDLTNPFFSVMGTLIQRAAQRLGYTLIIVCNQSDPELEYLQVQQAIARCSDGVLLFPTTSSAHSIELLQSAHMPFVVLSVPIPEYQTDSVIINDTEGAFLATKHLVEAGKRKLAFISSYCYSPSFLLRKEGFLRACDTLGIGEDHRRICEFSSLGMETRWNPAVKHEVESALIALKEEGFDGLFFFCDVEAWRALVSLGVSDILNLKDFGIVSFDNIDDVLVIPIRLCSVDCGLETMAEESIALLCSRIEGDTSPSKTIVCPVHVVCRESCMGQKALAEST